MEISGKSFIFKNCPVTTFLMNAFITTVALSGPQSIKLCAARSFAQIKNFLLMAARNVCSNPRLSLKLYKNILPEEKDVNFSNFNTRSFRNALVKTKLKSTKTVW